MNNRLFAKILWLSFGLLISMSPGFSQSIETSFLDNAKISPSRLEWQKDSVFFSIKGSIPIISGFLPRNPRLKLVFTSSDKELDLGEIELTKKLSEYVYDQKITFQYQSWMDKGRLAAQFLQGSKNTIKVYESKILATGISAIPLLMHIGLQKSSLTHPEVGWMITKNLQDTQKINLAEFAFNFDIGSALLSRTSVNQRSLNDLRAFLRQNPLVTSLKITGLQSPELAEGRNSKLGMDRALAVLESLKAVDLEFRDEVMSVDARWRDWFDFRVLLHEQLDLTEVQKEKYYDIFQNGSDFLSQSQDLTKVSGFDGISKRLFPLLRSAKVEIQASQIWGLDPIILDEMRDILRDSTLSNTLSRRDWEIASAAADSPEDREKIFRKMLIFFKSVYASNNLAVLLMRQAQQLDDIVSKEYLLQEAENLLTEAGKIEINPFLLHNHALLLLARGSEWEAYRKLSIASGQSKEISFLIQNENLRAALDVWRGDYKLARIRYDYPTSDPKALFNKGIVFFLAKEFEPATVAFEESVMASRDFGFGFYGLALIAASIGQEDIAWIHLQKAILLEDSIFQMAKFEPIFDQVRTRNASFFGD